MAVLEAAAHSIPVIQTTECNFPELAIEGGAWEANPTIESVREQLLQALSCDDLERKSRGKVGFELVSKHYSWASIAERLVQACRNHV